MQSKIKTFLITMPIALVAMAPTSVFAAPAAQTATSNTVGTEVDNSKVNERDQAPSQVTADQQGGESDTEITRQIRQAIVKDESLSTYAHNIKIITINGKVTLKGPVHSSEEKMKVEKFAKTVAGVNKVENLISIKK